MKVKITVPVEIEVDFDTDGADTVHISEAAVRSAAESQLSKAVEEMASWDDDNLSDALSDATGWCVSEWNVTVGDVVERVVEPLPPRA